MKKILLALILITFISCESNYQMLTKTTEVYYKDCLNQEGIKEDFNYWIFTGTKAEAQSKCTETYREAYQHPYCIEITVKTKIVN